MLRGGSVYGLEASSRRRQQEVAPDNDSATEKFHAHVIVGLNAKALQAERDAGRGMQAAVDTRRGGLHWRHSRLS